MLRVFGHSRIRSSFHSKKIGRPFYLRELRLKFRTTPKWRPPPVFRLGQSTGTL